MKKLNHFATLLILLFVILFFTPLYSTMPIWLAFGITLSVSLISLCIGIYSFFKLKTKGYSVAIIFISFLILLFTLFAFLLPEAGYPAPIQFNLIF